MLSSYICEVERQWWKGLVVVVVQLLQSRQMSRCREEVDHLPEENEREIRQTVEARPPNSAVSGNRQNALRRK